MLSLTAIILIICVILSMYTNITVILQATVVCDLVLLYLLPKREFYKNMKFKYTDTHVPVSSPVYSMMHIK